VVITSPIFQRNFNIDFHINITNVEGSQCVKEDCFIQSNNANIIGVICVSIYGAVVTMLLILLSWKHFKSQNISKCKGIIKTLIGHSRDFLCFR